MARTGTSATGLIVIEVRRKAIPEASWRKEQQGAETALAEGMRHVAQELVLAARKIAEDPFAASPFMERAVEEGLAIEGGKLDDISVVAATVCKRKEEKG